MMPRAKFVYVTYIAAPREQVWDALIDGEMTKQYWGHENVSDWKPGSKWEHQRANESRKIDLTGTVVENSRPNRLVITWAYPNEIGDPEKVSRVAFDLEPYKDGHTRLTLTHDDLEPGSKMESGISFGWPLVLSNLKSFVETGRAMPL